MIVSNSDSVGLPHGGDQRASYLLVDDSKPKIRRVAYEVDRELKALFTSGLPHAHWIAKMLDSACLQMP
jgi:diadenosine tetraphosphatase ApaH/serine/threonine PP2A family protein phosphatase